MRTCRIVAAVLGALLALGVVAPLAVAELADVFLKDGRRLRGDVTESEDEVVLRNAAGEMRFARDDVERVEYLPLPRSADEEFRERARRLEPADLDGHFALAEWCRQKRRYDLVRIQCNYILAVDPGHANARLLLAEADTKLAEAELAAAPAVDDGAAGPVLPPPLLNEADINRLRLYEVRLHGPLEELQVRLVRRRGEPDVEALVRADLELLSEGDLDAAGVLERGRPPEKLRTILRSTGLKYADRIELRGDPEVFGEFRRRVLPHVVRGCATAGCHSGPLAEVFRFPVSPRQSDAFAYTTFLMLDSLATDAGRVIDRAVPEESLLLSYLVDPERAHRRHPPVRRGRLTHPFRNDRDAGYRAILDWILSLRMPHPGYELAYERPAVWTARRTAPASVEAAPGEMPEGPADEGAPQPDDPPDKPAGDPGR